MNKSIENLLDKEETVTLELKNMHYQVKQYREKLKQLKVKYPDQSASHQMSNFKKIFKYYDKHLIPALMESAALEQKHIAVIKKNPDPKFKPLVQEVQYHQQLTNEYRKRFRQIHKEFSAYLEVLGKLKSD